MKDAFAPPRSEGPALVGWSRTWWFVRSRVLRLASAAAIWGLWANLLWPRSDWVSLAAGALGGIALWMPTSTLLFRIVFFPGEPDPRLVDADDRPSAPEDHRWSHRIVLMEHLLGAVPLVLFAAWAIIALPDPARWGGLLFLPAVAATIWQLHRGTRRLVLHEATIDLATGDAPRARRWLHAFPRFLGPLPPLGWRLLAVAEQQTGHVEAALRSLEPIRGDEEVESMRARLLAEFNDDDARGSS